MTHVRCTVFMYFVCPRPVLESVSVPPRGMSPRRLKASLSLREGGALDPHSCLLYLHTGCPHARSLRKYSGANQIQSSLGITLPVLRVDLSHPGKKVPQLLVSVGAHTCSTGADLELGVVERAGIQCGKSKCDSSLSEGRPNVGMDPSLPSEAMSLRQRRQ